MFGLFVSGQISLMIKATFTVITFILDSFMFGQYMFSQISLHKQIYIHTGHIPIPILDGWSACVYSDYPAE